MDEFKFTFNGKTFIEPLVSDSNIALKCSMKNIARRVIYEVSKLLDKPVHDVKFNIHFCDEIEGHITRKEYLEKKGDWVKSNQCISISSLTFEERGHFKS